jgi:UDP-perosamine 4-acetyltransferase
LRERAVVIGAGGHAKVIIEILEEQARLEIAGCVSRQPGGEVLGYPVLGDDGILPALYTQGVRKAFVAIGDNRARRSAMERAAAAGFELINAVSRHSAISARARLGCGVAVMPGAVVNVMSRIGDGAIVNTGATVDHDCDIGRWAHIAPGTNLAGGVTIGDGVFLGVGSRVLPGISVGPWTTVGAGAVVIGNLPGAVTAVGVPAVVREKAGGIET